MAAAPITLPTTAAAISPALLPSGSGVGVIGGLTGGLTGIGLNGIPPGGVGVGFGLGGISGVL